MLYLKLAIVFMVAYLIGSIPTGYAIVKAKTGKDLRTLGSGSTGATNVKRVLGKKWFIIVMILDFLKGALPVIMTYKLFKDPYGYIAFTTAVGIIIGHSKSVFLGFKGGKSVASGIGALFAMSPVVGILIAFIWACVTFVTKYVSVGSIVAIIFAPIYMIYYKRPIMYSLFSIIAAIYIIFMHKDNIIRLLKGEENKIRK